MEDAGRALAGPCAKALGCAQGFAKGMQVHARVQCQALRAASSACCRPSAAMFHPSTDKSPPPQPNPKRAFPTDLSSCPVAALWHAQGPPGRSI